MKNKTVLILLLYLLGNIYSFAGETKLLIKPQGLEMYQNNNVIELSFYTPSIVRIQKFIKGENVGPNELSVTLTPEKVNVISNQIEDFVSLKTKEMKVILNKKTGQIVFFDKNGNETLKEKAEAYSLSPIKDGQFNSYNVKQTFLLDKNEPIYGLGQLQNGDLSQRGKTYWQMVEGNTSVWIPYICSVKGYALYWDNYSPTNFIDNDNGMTFESSTGYGINYYYLAGSKDSGDKAVAEMRELTGKTPMLPLWAFGYFQSKERYKSAEETMEVVKRYRDLGVPLDGIVQDWQYWGNNNQWNSMDFLNPNFKNYRTMIDSVHSMHAKLMISIWANFGRDTKQFAHFKETNALIKSGDTIMTMTYPPKEGVGIYDPYNKTARDYYWQSLFNGLVSKGIDAYWMDSSEPDHYQGGDDREKTFDYVTGLGCTWRSVRNAFPLEHVGGVYDHHRAESFCNSKRAVILTRSAFAGQQRYGAITWSGDVTASWETLAKQIPAALNFTICGNPNWNSDIGGFFNGKYKGPGEDAYNELYVRWIQFGTFCSMMRSHGAGTDRAIYQYGKPGTKYYDAIAKYIDLRYSLLPYIYSTEWSIHYNGSSFMRALAMAYPKDKNTYDDKQDFLFGSSILVAPVLEPNATKRNVYLPKGNDWIDFWTGQKQKGGDIIVRNVDLETLPIYIKSGSIIPWGPKVQYSTQKKWDNLEIRVYGGANGQFVLYEDEFDNYNYEKGAYTTIKFNWDDIHKTMTIANREGSYKGMLQKRRFKIVLVNEKINNIAKNKTIYYTGKKVTVKF